MNLADAILEFNRPYVNPLRGAEIHEIDQPTAAKVADLLRRSSAALVSRLPDPQSDDLARLPGAPLEGEPSGSIRRVALCYFCAVVGQESRFDPAAYNRNLSVLDHLRTRPTVPVTDMIRRLLAETDTEKERWALEREIALEIVKRGADPWLSDPENKGDWGVAMFKLFYVRQARDCPELHGLPTVDVIEGFLYDPDWALPKMASRYAMNLQAAARDYPALDARWAATGIYKAGTRGFREAYAAQSGPSWGATVKHIGRVQTHYGWFFDVLDSTEEADA